MREERPCPASALLAWVSLLALSFHHRITGQLQAHTQDNLTYAIELLVCAEYEARLALRSSNDESDHPAPALCRLDRYGCNLSTPETKVGRSLQVLKASLTYTGNATLSQGRSYGLLVPR